MINWSSAIPTRVAGGLAMELSAVQLNGMKTLSRREERSCTARAISSLPAPDFELTDTEGQTVRLSDFRGKKNVVLALYVLAFTGG